VEFDTLLVEASKKFLSGCSDLAKLLQSLSYSNTRVGEAFQTIVDLGETLASVIKVGG